MVKHRKAAVRILLIILVVGIIGGVFLTIYQYNKYTSQIPASWYVTKHTGQYYLTGNEATDLAISGNFAYVSDNIYGMDVINISNPANPQLLFQTSGYSSQTIAVSDNIAYVGCVGGMKIYNVTNPANPVQIGFYNVTTRQIYEISIFNQTAYITIPYTYPSYEVAVNMVNITNPATPTFIGKIDCSSVYARVAVSGNIVCMADAGAGMRIIDISNQSDPHQTFLFREYGISPQPTVINAKDVKIIGNYAYLSDTVRELIILNISNPYNPIPVSFTFNGGNSDGLDVHGNFVYITHFTQGFMIYNTTNTSAPVLLGNYHSGLQTTCISVVNDTAYLIDSNGLNIVTITPGTGKDYPLPPFNVLPLIGYFGILSLCIIIPYLYVRVPESL